jgi:signal transduction histidine kinase/DNA-binding response OmpR family regulator
MLIKNLLLLISILLISNLSTAQSEDKIPDLKLSIQEEQDEAKKIDLYIELARTYLSNNPKEGLTYAHKSLTLSRKIKEPTLTFRAAETIFGLHFKTSTEKVYNDSLATYIKVIEQANKKINEPLYQVKTFKNKATYYYRLGDYEKAIDFNIKGYELSKKHQLPRNIQARLLNNLSNVLYLNKNYNEALKYYKQALALADNDLQKGRTLFNIGSLYRNELNQHDTAYIYFNEAHSYFEKVDNKQFQAITLMNKGNYFDYKNEFDKAMSFYQEAYTIIVDNNLSYYLNIINKNFASHYYLSNQYQLAIQYGEKSINWETLDIGYEEEVYQVLYKSYAKVGNYKKAYQLQQDYISYQDSIELIKLDNKVEELQTKFQVKEQKAENDLLKANIKQKNILNIGSILILILLGIIIWVLRHSNQLKKSQNEVLEEKVAERTTKLLSTTKELEQIKAIQLLEEAKSRFFANVSHEFRTPLTLIQGPLQSIIKSPRLNLKEQNMMRRALSNSKSLSRLVNQVLDLSKLDANKMTLNEEPIVLFLLIRRIIANFESHAQRNGISLQLEYRIYHELKINLDKDKFEKILNNYISNAIKFTPRDGKISIIVTDLQADIQIAVADTGIGIPKNEIDAVFDRYYQVKGFDKDAPLGEVNHYTGGTGIGLSLCKDYAELFGGKVWAESPNEYGTGSTFYFQFPKKELFEANNNQDALDIIQLQEMPIAGLSNKQKNEVSTISNQDNSNILIVEDNHDLRAFLKELLEEDYEVITVENGQAALDEINNNAFELVISDVMMPIMDGFQLLESLKASDKYRHIPMMMLTARAELKDKLKALRLGVDDYMLKPFDEAELKARVSNLILNINSRREALTLDKSQNNQIDIPNLEHSNQDSEWLQNLEKKVLSNISNIHFTSNHLAEELLMSRSHLFRKIKSLTGLTVNQYMKEARMQTARMLLEQRKVSSVKETAYQVGFKHIHYFSQSYSKRFGKKPSEYF